MEVINNRRLLIIMLIAGALFYFRFDPLETTFMPQCLFHRLTGLQCVGCGTQRMLHSLLHGDISGAIRANAFLTFSLPVIAVMVWVNGQRMKRPDLYRMLHSRIMLFIIILLMLLWMIIRNIIGI